MKTIQNPAFLIDVDRTLTDSKKEITQETISTIKKIQERYKLGLATGRSFATLKNYILPHFDKKTIHIVAGGGEIIDNSGKILWQKIIPNDIAKMIFEKSIECKTNPIICKDDYLYLTAKLLPIAQKDFWRPKAKTISIDKINNLALITIYNTNQKLISYLKSITEINCKFMTGYTNIPYVDITAKNITKATSIKKWAQLNQISFQNIIAIGDSENDIEMIKKAKLGIAMGNAVDELKKVADQIIDHTNNNGLAKYLQQYLS